MKVIKKSIEDERLLNRHFYYLHQLINNDQIQKIQLRKTYQDLLELNYITKITKNYNGYYSADIMSNFEYIAIDELVWNYFNNTALIKKLYREYSCLKGWFRHRLDNGEIREISGKLLRLYAFLRTKNENDSYFLRLKELKNLRLTGCFSLEFLTYMLKKLNLFDKTSGVFYQVEKKPIKQKNKKFTTIGEIQERHVKNNLNAIQNIYTFHYSLETKYSSVIPKNISGVYVYTNEENVVLYVGKAKDLKSRTYSHLNGLTNTRDICSEFTYLSFVKISPDKYDDAADFIEKDLIKTLCPKYNKVHNKTA
ncbi:GIY-YIG nuclease family protein [Bacillus velezensis]|uniref:GIY-YIG nuclease family protein n=1 Tax=Bacillus velezensis TaxID=492670 RepID=UPI002E10AFA0